MILDGGRLHVFFQVDPYFPHAPKRTGWGHASVRIGIDPLSPEAPRILSAWRFHPDALTPNRPYDKDGAYTGCAVRDDEGDIHFLYTGNIRDDGHGNRRPSQNLVHVHGLDGRHGGMFTRSPHNPVIDGHPAEFTGHVRDPYVTRDPDNPGMWRMILGAQLADGTAGLALYRSPDLQQWTFDGPITVEVAGDAVEGDAPDMIPSGYMWECPNLLRMRDVHTGEDLDVLILCPQGMKRVAHHYMSSDQCGYIVGRLEGSTFRVTRGFCELDLGHEFYAPQMIAHTWATSDRTVAADAILVGWAGLPAADDQPTLADDWVHTLTAPRRVRLVRGRLVQEFILAEMVARDFYSGTINTTLIPASPAHGATLMGLFALPEPPVDDRRAQMHISLVSEQGVTIPIDIMRNRPGDVLVRVDRSAQTYHDGPDVRGAMILREAIDDYEQYVSTPSLAVYVDGSIVEIQVAGYTLTSRLFLERGDAWVGLE